MTFSDAMSKFNQKAEKAMTKTFRGTALSLFSKIVIRTPVGNPSLWKSKPPKGYVGGRLRGNWQVSLRKFPGGTIGGADEAGSKTISKGKSAVNAAKLGDIIYISNNLPYAGVIENGSSTQAPQGMVRVTVAEFQAVVDANVRKAKR